MKKILVFMLVSVLVGSACAETGSEDTGFWISPITPEGLPAF